jgi:hypothetical protein
LIITFSDRRRNFEKANRAGEINEKVHRAKINKAPP